MATAPAPAPAVATRPTPPTPTSSDRDCNRAIFSASNVDPSFNSCKTTALTPTPPHRTQPTTFHSSCRLKMHRHGTARSLSPVFSTPPWLRPRPSLHLHPPSPAFRQQHHRH